MSVEKAIVCDGCAGIMESGKTAAAVRAGIRRDWPGARVALPGGRDLCPDCAAFKSSEPYSAEDHIASADFR